jgi:hypothetical protein
MGWDDFVKFSSHPIPSHVSHGIPWDEYLLQNFDFITNSITVFVIDGSLANSNDTK